MKNRTQFTPFIIAALCLLCSAATSSRAATPTATPKPTPLNEIKIGHCNDPKRTLESIIEAERARGLVMDARPFAINQATGKMTFDGSTGRVSVVNTNPFVYKYKITVAQEELVSTALTDFLKLLLPESLRSNVGLQSGRVNPTASRVTPITKLGLIAERLRAFDPAKCRDNAACEAVSEMKNVFELIEQQGLILNSRANDLDTEALLFTTPALSIDEEFAKYTEQLSLLRDEEADAYTVCDNATKLNDDLRKLEPQLKQFLEDVSTARKEIKKIDVLASDLEGLVAAFNRDEDLKTAGKAIRCKGFNCVEQFQEYAQTVLALIGTAGYSGELSRLETNAQEMLNMFQLTEQMKEKEGLFARTFTVIKKFELSQASIALNRTRLQTSGGSSTATSTGPQSGNAGTGGGGGGGRGSGSPEPSVVGGESSEGSAGSSSGGNNFAASGDGDGAASGDDDKDSSAKDSEGGSTAAPAGQIREVVQIGRPRFMLSGGLVYSPLPRRTFKKVTGFALDAQGQPTGDGDADVVGYDQNSSRRLLPMVLLNTRLLSSERASLHFSFGVSAKHDDNMDIEYLVGPSIGLLNDRALFTFGAYGGLTQNLVNDVKVGDELPDDVGDAKLFRKSYTWKPGFSFSYSFSRVKKGDASGGTGDGSTSTADELKNEIRIGNIPFNLAVGMAYTSLEQRTYDEVVGFARDRQGNLTNGRTLTRIVGLTSSSNYRLTPLALLHSRLTKLGGHDLYFSTGVTGKKTDEDFDIEYLLGASVNLYRRKVFLTFGAFAGKQQILGGDYFEGARLGATQEVTTQDRYVWKPALAISYDISNIIPRPK